MSISTRIEAIEQHLTDDYSVLTLAGADLTNVDKNILNLKPTWKERLLYFMNNGTQVVWNNWSKVNGTGTTLTLNNTEEAPMSLVYKGNTLQNGTPTPDSPVPIQVVSGDNSIEVVGKNLWNENTQVFSNQARFATSKDSNNVWTFTITGSNGYAFATSNITLQAGTYTVSATVDNGDFIILKGSTTQPNTFTLTEETTMTFRVYKNGNIGDVVKLSQVMLNKGTTALSYEEYKSASYPISLGDIEFLKIGTYQDSIKKSTGKNLFDKDNVENNKRLDASGQLISNSATGFSTTGYIKVKPNTKYTYSRNTTSSSYYVNICEYTSDKTHIQRLYSAGDTTTKYVFTTPSNCEYLRINDATTNLGTIQLEEGDIQNPTYEPYGTGWFLNKQIRKVILDGTENWETGAYGTNSYKLPAYSYGYMIEDPNRINIITNLFKGVAFVNRTTSGDNIIYNDSSYFYIRNTSYTSLADFKTMLGTNNMTLYYVLNTPTYTEITDSTLLSQLNALAKSYASQTNISQENNDMPFILDITALSKE